jgi:hypothetical protein
MMSQRSNGVPNGETNSPHCWMDQRGLWHTAYVSFSSIIIE